MRRAASDASADPRQTGWRQSVIRRTGSDLLVDLQQAVRRLAQRRAFTVTAVLTLAAGIGTTTAVFSVVDAVLFRPPPWHDPAALVRVHGVSTSDLVQANGTNATQLRGLRWPGVLALRSSEAFADIAVWVEPTPMVLRADRDAFVRTLRISSNFLSLLGVTLERGEGFSEADDTAATGVALVTHEAWQSRFGGRPDILGLPLIMADTFTRSAPEPVLRRIVGVLPPGMVGDLALFYERRAQADSSEFLPLEPPEILLPLEGESLNSRSYRTIARLAAGTTTDSAAVAAESVVVPLDARLAGLRLESLFATQTAGFAPPLVLLFGGAGLLLLVACANVAGLLMSQARTRRTEIAVRRALGAGHGAVLRQLTVEHLVLAAAAAAVGMLLAWWLTPVLSTLIGERIPRADAVEVSYRIAGFALLATVVTTVVFGTVPSWVLARTPAAEALAQGGRAAITSQRYWHRGIVAGEIAFGVVLLVGANLFGTTFLRLSTEPLGFDTDPAQIVVMTTRYTDGGVWDAGPVDQVVERLAAVPGALRAAASTGVPFMGLGGVTVGIGTSGGVDDLASEPNQAQVNTVAVTSGYFDALGMPIVAGRGFSRGDVSQAGAVVVSQTFEREILGGEAVGRVFTAQGRPLEVIGVVPDTPAFHPSDRTRPIIYYVGQTLELPGNARHFVVQSETPSADMIRALSDAVVDVSPRIAVMQVTTLDAVVARSLAAERFRAVLSVVFAAAALALVAMGLFGLAARVVADRERELGLRVALGASPAAIRALAMREGIVTTAVGLFAGMLAAFAAVSATAAWIPGTGAATPQLFLVSAVVVVGASLGATVVPAARAARTDPALTLRG